MIAELKEEVSELENKAKETPHWLLCLFCIRDIIMKNIQYASIIISTIVGVLFFPVILFADNGAPTEESWALFASLELVILALMFVALFFNYKVAKEYAHSTLGYILNFFFLSVVLLALTRVYIFVAYIGLLGVSEKAIVFGWHMLFYLAMITFFIGIRKLLLLFSDHKTKLAKKLFLRWTLFLVLFVAVIFFFIKIFESTLLAFLDIFVDTPLESFGSQHFIAFVLAATVSWYLFKLKEKESDFTSVLATPLLIAFLLWSLDHFWELLTESWKVIEIPSTVIEQVEQIIVFPAVAFMVYAFARLWYITRNVSIFIPKDVSASTQNKAIELFFLQDIIIAQASIVGLDVAVYTARKVPGLEISDDGKVGKYDGNIRQTAYSLSELYRDLSGAFFESLIKEISAKYPTIKL